MHSPPPFKQGHTLRPGKASRALPLSWFSPYHWSDPSTKHPRESEHTMNETLKEIAHQLTRIADQQEQATMQITREDALKAWDIRIYEREYLTALTKLGIQIVD